MEWIRSVNRALEYIEAHLCDDLTLEAIARSAYASDAHFGRAFSLVTGLTVFEYVRNRRLSMAGRALTAPGARVLEVALDYRYDTPESFSKAFTRFHGVSPSEVKNHRGSLKFYAPLHIEVSVKGGFIMPVKFMEEFCWNDALKERQADGSPQERYQALINWAGQARGRNPRVFDDLTSWLLDDAEWTQDHLMENEQILRYGVIERFKQQNELLRGCLDALQPSGVVNPAVYKALDQFDEALLGHTNDPVTTAAATRAYTDFSAMTSRELREKFAGGLTGPTGTNGVALFGYVNVLKDCDAGVQWTLFMPDEVKQQQNGFRVERFEYCSLPAMRFIGREGDDLADISVRKQLFDALDAMPEAASSFPFDLLLFHFDGKNVDIGQWHGLWGRFMQAGTPVPEGMTAIDFLPSDDGRAGAPFVSQFAHAVFTGDTAAMHQHEGHDGDGVYDVTRNIILGQGVCIPYPNKYWTAEVYQDGFHQDSKEYLFSTLMG